VRGERRMGKGMKTIGLCMIVKNESAVIQRCLESARGLVDYVLVEDTGSTDGTRAIIRKWLAGAGLPGEVYNNPWRNFAYNRSHALAQLRKKKNIDYALILDADDYLVFEPGFEAAALNIYNVEMRNARRQYWSPQICSNRLKFRYRGVVHEFLDTPDGALSWGSGKVAVGTVGGFHIWSTREGARNQDPNKYRKDAQLLENALKTEKDGFLCAPTRSI
jgi:glycosyltransferase involved in cell wall biosynthesis